EQRRARGVETRVEERQRRDPRRERRVPVVPEEEVRDERDDPQGDRADEPPGSAVSHDVRKNAAAAAVMTAVAPHPRTFSHTPLANVLGGGATAAMTARSEEHTSEPQSRGQLVCGLLYETKNYAPVPKEPAKYGTRR